MERAKMDICYHQRPCLNKGKTVQVKIKRETHFFDLHDIDCAPAHKYSESYQNDQ